MKKAMTCDALPLITFPISGHPEIQIAALHVESLPVERWLADGATGISAQRKAHALRFLQRADRQRCVGATLVLDRLLDRFHLHEAEMVYAENEQHKPCFKDHPELEFNMSHSGAYALCALAPFPIGVDIQERVPYQTGVARLCMTAPEMALFEQTAPESRDTLFTNFWCLKEAVMKARGTGITEDHFPIFQLKEGLPQLADNRYPKMETHLLRLEGYSVGVAYTKKD